MFAQKIFCGWEYSIATPEAAELKSQATYHELKVYIFLFSNSSANDIIYSLKERKYFYNIFRSYCMNL